MGAKENMTEEIIRKKYMEMGISSEVYAYGKHMEDALQERFQAIDRTVEFNQMKVIGAMQKKTPLKKRRGRRR